MKQVRIGILGMGNMELPSLNHVPNGKCMGWIITNRHRHEKM